MGQDQQTKRDPEQGLMDRLAAAESAADEVTETAAPAAVSTPPPAAPVTGPPPLPGAAPGAVPSPFAAIDPGHDGDGEGDDAGADAVTMFPPPAPPRRVARRRPAGPARGAIAANDDAPSIGGLIFALEQKPSTKPFRYAAIASAAWAIGGVAFAWFSLGAEVGQGASLGDLLVRPTTFLTFAAIVVPAAVMWFLALLAWRAEELRLRSSTMTEVAIRLAEPDRMAEQSIASLGQAVRRQVSFMNDAVSRALGRAGELEALVHNEVAALERSYEDNERKIRGLIKELAGERDALLGTSVGVTETLKQLGTEVPNLIDKLSGQQVKLAQIIAGAGDNLNALESSLATSAGRLEEQLGTRTSEMQQVLETYTSALGQALGNRTEDMQRMLADYTSGLADALGSRTENLQTVFEEYARALDETIARRADHLDERIIERTRALDEAFGERLKLFDESIVRSVGMIDHTVGEKAEALTTALESHAKTFGETIARQAVDLDEALIHGVNAVRRSSENITRQSLKAIEGLSNQSDLLKTISESLLAQINTVTNRFESQGQNILRAAGQLENVNHKIDATLQIRHQELSHTLDQLSGKADEFGQFVQGYSSTIEGSLSDAELRARRVAEELKAAADLGRNETFAHLERMKAETDAQSHRVLEDLRHRMSSVSQEVSQQLGSLSSRFTETSEEVRQRAARAARDLAEEQDRLRREFDRLPETTRESAEAMRRALQEQLRALDQVTALSSREAARRDVTPPSSGAKPAAAPRAVGSDPGGRSGATGEASRSLSSLSQSLAGEMRARRTRQGAPPQGGNPAPAGHEDREGWSLGDLLARASRDDDGPRRGEPAALPPAARSAGEAPFSLDIAVIARALDQGAANAIWSRIRTGQRGIMVRSIYSTEGRSAFDEVSRRYASDPNIRATVDRYLADFEAILREADQKDPSGRLALTHGISDTGRVYLFLAHASGRLS
ncbi:MAG: hypothetical protein AB1749_14040 [Pseudomonadota bacterium]